MSACDICRILVFCLGQNEYVQFEDFPKEIDQYRACKEGMTEETYLKLIKDLNYDQLKSDMDYYDIRCIKCGKIADESFCEECKAKQKNKIRSNKAKVDKSQGTLF